MTLMAIVREDMVIGRGTGLDGVAVPALVAELPLERLRYDGETLIDAATIEDWYIDASGAKRLEPGAGRQPLMCAWDARLEIAGGAWVAVDADEAAKRDLKAAAQTKRQQVIAGGCTVAVDGVAIPIWADDRTVATLTALSVRALANPALVIPQWRARDGQFYELNAADIAALAEGLFTFINEAFEIEGEVVADIDAENITTLAEIDAAGWPEN